jgi:signal transduction histidine kinase
VELINNAAKQLLKISQLKNIKALEPYSKKLVKTMFKLTAGEKALVKVDDNGELLQLAVYASQFKLRGQKFTLVSLQNIQSELEEKEMEAWQNLIRVLTHEIMNSVTPIASLASTVNDLLTDSPNQEKPIERIDTEIISDVRGALQTIEKRSHGLLNFVDAYRNLTRIPRPNLQIVSLSEFFSRLKKLMHSQITEGSIDLQVHIEPDNLQLAADPELIEQVLINLLLNAIEAVAKQPNPVIKIFAKLDDKGRITIQVIDNGTGISEEIAEKIFIPFFTTKKKGSGIGLSLSRQIMRMHRGSLGVLSKKGETIFTLKF